MLHNLPVEDWHNAELRPTWGLASSKLELRINKTAEGPSMACSRSHFHMRADWALANYDDKLKYIIGAEGVHMTNSVGGVQDCEIGEGAAQGLDPDNRAAQGHS